MKGFRMFKVYTVAVICVASMLIPFTARAGAVNATVNVQVPLDLVVFVPCANGGAGENVEISGTLHILLHITINDNRVNIKEHFQPQDASGVGEDTGDVYHAVGVTQDQESFGAVSDEFTFINNFRIVGQGPGNNFQVHENVHITINANGDVTSVHDNLSATCG
jgi:hypothetical protein